MFVVVGAAAPCRLEPESSWLVAAELLALTVVELAAVRLGRLTARAAAPTTPAAPAPRVIADTQASPLLRASCRAEAEVGELVMALQSRLGGRKLSRCSLSMGPHSITGLCCLWVLPLNCL